MSILDWSCDRKRPRLRGLMVCALLAMPLSCTSDVIEAETLLANLEQYVGKRVLVRARFRSGARCRLETPDGEWKTYCRNCQYCRGPIVLDVGTAPDGGTLDDWPLILGGVWRGRDVRCTGKLNEVQCYPLEPKKTYVVRGWLEDHHPRRLLLRDFWEVSPTRTPSQ